MIWLSASDELGEVECIFPTVVENPPCKPSGSINKQTGFPILAMTSEPVNEVCIQFHEEDFTIWFVTDKVIDSQIQADAITFLIANANELVGIICGNVINI
ncbi:hypothetical protein [Paenibacillus campi]|uniref:hypothetical protein n=1 Tax=Paenibacillus campi TaxID=3106031 RepID=UPI002B002B9E|nr:hypothetical protein [Paenibacillus sp. SGZ-1009]